MNQKYVNLLFAFGLVICLLVWIISLHTTTNVETKQITDIDVKAKQTAQLFKGKIHSTTIDDYKKWLKGYLQNGGIPTHSYDYPITRVIDGWYIANANFSILPLFGSNSISVIVPNRVTFRGENLGHNQLYLMDGYINIGNFVPIYNDIHFSDPELNNILQKFRDEELKKDTSYKKELEKEIKEIKKKVQRVHELLQGNIRPATVNNYIKWLRGYLQKGGKVTHTYDYPMDRVISSWVVAHSDFAIAPLHGSYSLNIIVLNGVKFNGGNLGHSKLYFMDEFTHESNLVPIYTDVKP